MNYSVFSHNGKLGEIFSEQKFLCFHLRICIFAILHVSQSILILLQSESIIKGDRKNF